MTYDTSKLDLFSSQPGVYIMKSRDGSVLYVGKAKNLKQRVKQYFVPGRDGRFMIPFLVAKVHEIETILVLSEKEALLLENTLIKEYKPRYNALLKDDKTYIALKINNKHPWPMIQLVRYRGKPKPDGLYFGPYTSAHAARQTLDFLNRIFPLRQCSDQELMRRTRPCILYDMKRCMAPCVNKCTKEDYLSDVDRAIKFLRGQDKEVLKELYNEMHRLAEGLEFEKAGEIFYMISQIEKTIETQLVDKPLGVDSDVLAVFRQGEEVILSQLFFRSGKLVGSKLFNFENIAQDDQELIESFLVQQYEKQEDLPHEILIPTLLSSAESVEELISTSKRRKVSIQTPKRGEKLKLIEMAYLNAETAFKQEKNIEAIREKTLLEMQEKLHLTHYPERIECFDISNISGSEIVAVMVAFTEGKKDGQRYRKYKIKSVQGQDDYASMTEVLMRRYKRAKEENDLPDLLVVDGGKGHLNVALKVLKELNIITLDVIGVAKQEGRHDRGMTSEQIFLPNIKDPIFLRDTSTILFLLQQIRDEAHRFAITFHRKRRNKQTLKSLVDDIPGIGQAKKRVLLRHFGSLKGLKEATKEELAAVPGISQRNIETILSFFQAKDKTH
jgi:excinuclease ABC subunit C